MKLIVADHTVIAHELNFLCYMQAATSIAEIAAFWVARQPA